MKVKNKKLVKIIITGHSGSGKTTISNKMADILNCPAIHGDEIMFDCISRFPEQTFSTFGVIPQSDGQTWFSNYFRDNTSIRNEQALPDMTKNYVEEQVSNIINSVINNEDCFFTKNEKAVYNVKSYSDIIIFEWHAASRLSHWQDANFRIFVKSNTHQRYKKLMSRMSNEGLIRPEIPRLRYLAIQPYFEKIKNQIDFFITNEYDSELQNQLIKICNQIKEK